MFWTAEFHDVWVSPNGKLFDITPKPHGETSILFVVDEKFDQEFNFDHRPGNQRQRIYEPTDPKTIARHRIDGMSRAQKRYEVERASKAKASLEDWVCSKVEKDPLAAAIDRFLSSCKAYEKYFDTLAVSGPVQIDRKLRELVMQRMKSQEAFKTALARQQKAQSER